MWVRGAVVLNHGQIGSHSQSHRASVCLVIGAFCCPARGVSVFVQLGVKSIFTYSD